jgi:hypothetical protein
MISSRLQTQLGFNGRTKLDAEATASLKWD